MAQKSSTGEPNINFKDFCKWIGISIEPAEDFYFRHDSFKNPGYETNQARMLFNENTRSK
jgi:hypothetical protein